MAYRGLLAGCGLLVFLGGCSVLEGHFTANREVNQGRIESFTAAETQNAVLVERTLFPYHFIPDSPRLSELGARDLGILAAHIRSESEPFFVVTKTIYLAEVYLDYELPGLVGDATAILEEAARILGENPQAEVLIDYAPEARWLGFTAAANPWTETVLEFMDSRGLEIRSRVLEHQDFESTVALMAPVSRPAWATGRFMVAEVEDFAGQSGFVINVQRGDVSEDVYDARTKMVLASLESMGVSSDLVVIGDGLPGGKGEPGAVSALPGGSGMPANDVARRLTEFREGQITVEMGY